MANKYYVDGDPKKMKSPLRSLWAIPIMIIIDIVVFIMALIGDSQLIPPEPREGHPFPVITFFALLVMALITIIVFVVAIATAVSRSMKASKENKNTFEENIE